MNLNKLREFLLSECHVSVTEAQAESVYKMAVSIHQSRCSRSGRDLENAIGTLLKIHHIPYITQACIHPTNGTIVPCARGLHRHDIIIDAAIGDAIENKIIVSCKVSLRERFLQDANVSCKRLYMVTNDDRAMKKKDELRTIHNIHLVHASQQSALDAWIAEIKDILASDKAD